MRDFLHNHGNKVIAVVGAALALSFILPGNFTGGSGPGGVRLGTLDGHRVTSDELRSAQNLLHSTERLIVAQQDQFGQPTPPRSIPEILFERAGMTKGQYDQLRSNPLLLHLLLTEASRAGATVDDRTLAAAFTAPVQIRYFPDQPPIEMNGPNAASDSLKAGLREDLRRIWSILAYHQRTISALKFTKPLLDEAVAKQAQQVKLRVAPFEAKAFADKIAAPTEEELQKQFTAYAATPPAVTGDNPFGFGYRVPNRAAVQWLLVPEAEARKVVDASKSEQDWQVEARVYYRKNPTQFSTTPSGSATPATQPTTRPYEDVAADAMKAVKDPEIERLKRKAAAAIVQQLNVDYGKASRTPSTQQAATAFGPAFGSIEYLQKLADQIQKQTGVRPIAVATNGLLTQPELAIQSGVGKARLQDITQGLPVASEVIFTGIRAFQTEPSPLSFDVGQPSPILSGDDGLYILRVTEIDPSHPAKQLADVRTEVERDVRRAKAYDAAEAAATAALAKATNGLDNVGVPVQVGDFYGIDNPVTPGLSDTLAGGAIGPAFEALKGLSSPAALPVRTLAKLKKDGIAAVVEVTAVKTDLNTENAPQLRMAAMRQIAEDLIPNPMAMSVTVNWFDFDNVARRVGYVAEKNEESSNEPKNAPKPVNPLVPG